jgi:hypothetical protein
MGINAQFGVEANIDSLTTNLLPFFQAYCCHVHDTAPPAQQRGEHEFFRQPS